MDRPLRAIGRLLCVGQGAGQANSLIVRPKILKLPEHGQFLRFVEKIEAGGGWRRRDCADLVRFLAFGGFRKSEPANVTWADCD
jgi:hypothetical protein